MRPKPDSDVDIVTTARRWRDRIMRTCDVPRAADMSLEMLLVFREHRKDDEATPADGMFALAMAAAVLAADAPPSERIALAAAIGLLILDCLSLAVERLATPQVLH